MSLAEFTHKVFLTSRNPTSRNPGTVCVCPQFTRLALDPCLWWQWPQFSAIQAGRISLLMRLWSRAS